MHCRACQKWLFLAASQWFINSFISCLANISRVLSNPGRLDTFLIFFLIAWILCELVALQRSRYFRNLCEEPMCSTAWTLSFSEGWIVLFIYFCTESPLRCDGRCVFFGGFFVYSYVLISSVGQPCYISEITGKRRRERLLIRRKRNRERCI